MSEVPCESGDVLLFCSDGLTGPLTDTEIARIVGSTRDLADAADKLVQGALDGGGPDNVTVALVKI